MTRSGDSILNLLSQWTTLANEEQVPQEQTHIIQGYPHFYTLQLNVSKLQN